MEPTNRQSSIWKFLGHPVMAVGYSFPIGYFVNEIFNIMANQKFGVVRFLPYIGSFALLLLITTGWWCCKRKEDRQRQESLPRYSQGTPTLQIPHSTRIPEQADVGGRPCSNLQVQNIGDGCQDALKNSRMTGESSNNYQSASSSDVKEDRDVNLSVLSPPTAPQDDEEIQNKNLERTRRDCPPESSGRGGHLMMNGDSAAGSNGHGTSDLSLV
ncbi:unnamed protein product [Calypogeia fissa]